jgi:hypothetical protein
LRARATAADGAEIAVRYEQLRNHAVSGIGGGDRFGLVILLREGVAAWMADASTQAAATTQRVAEGAPDPMPVVADELHADMVGVLANMVMATHQERCL